MRSQFAAALLSVALTGATQAAEMAPTNAKIIDTQAFDLSFSMGVMNARAKEIVYATPGDGSGLRPGARISQLDWTTSGAGLAGLSLGWNALPLTRIEASLHVPFSKNNGRMTDTDWLSADAYPDWSDRSQHPDTRDARSYIADIKIARQVFALDAFSLHALAGFRRTSMAWKAFGGTFVYTEANVGDCATGTFNGSSSFRNCTGAFDPVAQIGYRQTFNAPYLGLRGATVQGHWTFTADIVATPLAWSSDRDVHIESTLFKDHFRRQTMFGATVQSAYLIAPDVSLFLEADAQAYLTRKGVGEAWDVGTDDYSNFGANSAGISLHTVRVSAGVKGRF